MRTIWAQLSQDTDGDPSPSMPDVAAGRTHRTFTIGRYLALLLRNPPTIGEAAGFAPAIRYIYVLAVTEATDGPVADSTRFPLYLVTLEEGLATEPFLCVFDHHGGAHLNYGSDATLSDEDKFVGRAVQLVRQRFGIAEEAQELHEVRRSSPSLTSL